MMPAMMPQPGQQYGPSGGMMMPGAAGQPSIGGMMMPRNPPQFMPSGGMMPQFAPDGASGGNGFMMQPQIQQEVSYLTFGSPPTKLIAWSVLQMLLRVYSTDTTLPSPMETIGGKEDRMARFKLSMLSTSEMVLKYVGGSSDGSIDAIVGEKLILPFLETLNGEFPRYCTMATITPFYGSLNLDSILMQNVHQMKALFSVICRTSLPACFDYQGIPLHFALMFAQAYIKTMLMTLFARSSDSVLINSDLFDAIGKNYPTLAKLQTGTFMQDRMQDATFLETSVVSNKIVEVLRRTAVACFNHIATYFPFLHTNPCFQNGLTALQYSRKAY